MYERNGKVAEVHKSVTVVIQPSNRHENFISKIVNKQELINRCHIMLMYNIIYENTLKHVLNSNLNFKYETETSTQNYWVFGLFPSSGILGSRKHDVSETGSVSVLRCGGRHLLSWAP
jgi:hypothetical protein